ncbi:DUF5672 family protein [Flavobacterium johnsoniae]|jgi:hypothetical protein|uniref:DUF5672 family protein n=1 Tax=Flavobacterium johnsoniae TaxID=986 RepID=UPI0032033702
MGKEEICIVIPIFKEELNVYEIKSVKQCISILSDYSIYFIHPHGLNLDFYKTKFPDIELFMDLDKSYFKGIVGYNKLMLNVSFYKIFKKYKYMLIYHTDCYVFRDELLDWAKKKYDYIGGIWFEGFVSDPYLGAKIWKAGNGGFSLRKIDSFIKILSSKKPIKYFSELFKEKKKFLKINRLQFIKQLVFLPLNMLGYKNNYSYYARNYKLNEDFFFVEAFENNKSFKIPSVKDALFFSWDRHPSYLYQNLNSIPFGCHAWFRDDVPYEQNKDFWLNKIK